MLKEREPEEKEIPYKAVLRSLEKQMEEHYQKKKEKERQMKLEAERKEEEFRAGKGSNFPA